MNRPRLQSIDKLTAVARLRRGGVPAVTMSVGQWDQLLEECYSLHWILLELDDDERLVAAYRRPLVEGARG